MISRRLAAFAAVLLACSLLWPGTTPDAAATRANRSPAASRPPAANPAPNFWDDRFGPPGGSISQGNRTNDIALSPGGDLYAAGYGIQRWDGRRWHAVGTNPPGGEIHQLEFVGGKLYAGGQFTTAGGQTVNNLASWDGTSWGGVGGGVTNNGAHSSVTQLLARDGKLYVAGYFDRAGGSAASGWAVWDGSAWAAPEGAGAPGAPVSVSALTFDQGMLYASSAISETGRYQGRIMRWDGAAWTQLGPAFEGAYEKFAHGMQWYAGQLYLTGVFRIPGDPADYYVARWDGTRWQGIGTPAQVGGVVDQMAIRGGLLYFANIARDGQRALLTWDGSAWNRTGPVVYAPFNGRDFAFVRGFAQTASAFYIGGWIDAFEDSQGAAQLINHTAQLIDGDWHPLGSGHPSAFTTQDIAILAVGDEAYVFGDYGGKHVWNGRYWRALDASFRHDRIATDGRILYGHDGARLLRRDGQAWTPIGTPNGAPGAMQAGPSGLYGAGGFTAIDGVAVKGMARWDGASWHAVGDAAVSGAVTARHITAGGAYLGGAFTAVGAVGANHIARWDGSAWRALGAGIPESEIDAIVGADDDLYVLSHTTDNTFIRHWDGAEWTILVTMQHDTVRDIAMLDDKLVAAGVFSSIGGVEASGIARWDGASWQPLGSGLGGMTPGSRPGLKLAVSGHNLYAIGSFVAAGGLLSWHVARWNDTRTPVFIPAVLR